MHSFGKKFFFFFFSVGLFFSLSFSKLYPDNSIELEEGERMYPKETWIMHFPVYVDAQKACRTGIGWFAEFAVT